MDVAGIALWVLPHIVWRWVIWRFGARLSASPCKQVAPMCRHVIPLIPDALRVVNVITGPK